MPFSKNDIFIVVILHKMYGNVRDIFRQRVPTGAQGRDTFPSLHSDVT